MEDANQARLDLIVYGKGSQTIDMTLTYNPIKFVVSENGKVLERNDLPSGDDLATILAQYAPETTDIDDIALVCKELAVFMETARRERVMVSGKW